MAPGAAFSLDTWIFSPFISRLQLSLKLSSPNIFLAVQADFSSTRREGYSCFSSLLSFAEGSAIDKEGCLLCSVGSVL